MVTMRFILALPVIWCVLFGCQANDDVPKEGDPATGDTDVPSGDDNQGDSAVDDVDNPAERKRVFVTMGAFAGNMYLPPGGITAGDEQCANATQAASLDGSWVAWLSDGSINAIDRLQDLGSWYLVDRTTKVFENKAQLQAGPSVPIQVDEFGQQGFARAVWTGTKPGGMGVPEHCSNWTSVAASDRGLTGRTDATDGAWTDSTAETCTLYASLYCFEQ